MNPPPADAAPTTPSGGQRGGDGGPAAVVEGAGLRLRDFRPDDVADLVAAGDDPLARWFLPGLPAPDTEARARWWVAEGVPGLRAAGGVAYAVADSGTDRLLGGVALGNPVPQRRQAEIGCWVLPGARRRGVGTTATRLLAGHAFATGTARLELLAVADDPASQRVALAAGFRPEGVRRDAAATPDGGRQDLLAFVRLAGDPDGPVRRLLPDLPAGRLTDGVVTLRRLAPGDADEMYALHSRPEVVANQAPPVPPERHVIALRCRLAESQWLTGTAARLAILDAGTGRFAGSCGLVYAEPGTGQASIGYALAPGFRGRGLATRAVRLLAGWAFGPVGAARLVAGTVPDNTASHRVLHRVGFHREALLRGRLPGLAGTRLDDLTFALLPTDLTGDPPG
ncbi:GNAT family N-acetyltransferase [Micromonospora rosaria]|uniref:GNAT family N-acetyltransferase n=1 Tax=Micromonospora rosaria TaxID=47874 RepID=UPI000A06B726|nr:GNAT family N-acetyltransferase [Micromonospora rosaria]